MSLLSSLPPAHSRPTCLIVQYFFGRTWACRLMDWVDTLCGLHAHDAMIFMASGLSALPDIVKVTFTTHVAAA